jgi:hypothetical protein
VLLSSTHILDIGLSVAPCNGCSHSHRGTYPLETKFAELCAIMGDKKAKEIVERNEWLLQRASGITAKFAELVDAMGGGEKGTERAKKIVDQSPGVLQTGDMRGRFGRELTEIMGGDEERARKTVDQSPGY